MKKNKILSLFGLSTASFIIYSNFFKNRSSSSFLIENLFRLNRKKNAKKSTMSQLSTLFDESITKSEKPLRLPSLWTSSKTINRFEEDMQVFYWNDKHDKDQKVLYYLHGGGYVCAPLSFHFKMVDNIAKKTDAKVIFPIYPRLPQSNYKDAYPKLTNLYKNILSSVNSPQQITMMGDSAGGGLALGIALWLKNNNLPQPKDIILLSPWLDLATCNSRISSIVQKDPMLSQDQLIILGEMWADSDIKNPYASPLLGNPSNLGRISLFTGTNEIFYPDIMDYHTLLNQHAINHSLYVAPNMNHVFVAYPIPEAKRAQRKISDIITTS